MRFGSAKAARARGYLQSFFKDLLWRRHKVDVVLEEAPAHGDPAGTAHVVLAGRDRPARTAEVLRENLSDELEIRGFLDQFPTTA